MTVQDKKQQICLPQRKPGHAHSETNILIQYYPVHFVALFFTVINLLLKCSETTILTIENITLYTENQ